MHLTQGIFLVLVTLLSVSAKKERVRLTDVNTLTLYSDRWTTSRRSAPVKQLTCIGGHCSRVPIDTVQCYNRGFDGNDVQWECKAELPSNYKFGRLEVSCEGYEHPDDDHILAGSCGLEYTIVDATKTSNSYFPSSFSNNVKNSDDDGFSSMITIVMVIGAAIGLYIFLKPSRTNEQQNDTNRRSGFNTNPSAPPPPGFRPDCYGTSDGSGTSSSTRTSNDGPGFFSGMATGGLLGYMFGSNRGNTGYDRHHQSSYWNTRSTPRYSSFGNSYSDGGGGIRSTTTTSTGFASTKRR